jgi:hypothetical protein
MRLLHKIDIFVLLFKITKQQINKYKYTNIKMSDSNTVDTNNIEKTLDMLCKSSNHEDIVKYLSILLPDWLVEVAEEYAPEYSELNKTWDNLREKVNADKKGKILIVKYLPIKISNDSDRYISAILDMLVSKGYLLRRTSELIICPNTGYALVSKKMFDFFKRHNNMFPEKWYPYAIDSESSEPLETVEDVKSVPSEQHVGTLGNSGLRGSDVVVESDVVAESLVLDPDVGID